MAQMGEYVSTQTLVIHHRAGPSVIAHLAQNIPESRQAASIASELQVPQENGLGRRNRYPVPSILCYAAMIERL